MTDELKEIKVMVAKKVHEQLGVIAKKNHRSIRGEVISILEEHVAEQRLWRETVAELTKEDI